VTVGVLVMAYGGPDSLDDVPAYLMDVRGGRTTSPELVEETRSRYRAIGGRSPIRERTACQAAALERALASLGDYACHVGMRHWNPRIGDALRDMDGRGIGRAVGVVMAPHYSKMSIGAYFDAVAKAGSAIEVAPVEDWHLLPEYLEAVAGRVRDGVARFPEAERSRIRLLFTAHSLPERIRTWNDPYPAALVETMDAVMSRVGSLPHAFAYQSAGRTPEPWLGPDVASTIERFAGEGVRGVLVVPIGFTSDHVEVLYDVDIELSARARRLGIHLARIPMINDDARVMTGLARVVHERAVSAGWR